VVEKYVLFIFAIKEFRATIESIFFLHKSHNFMVRTVPIWSIMSRMYGNVWKLKGVSRKNPRGGGGIEKCGAPKRVSASGAPHIVTWIKQTWIKCQCTNLGDSTE